MKVSMEAKLFVIRQKLLEAERKIYECNKILAFLGDGNESPMESISNDCHDNDFSVRDPITGLYPGQIPDPATLIKQEDEDEEITACVE